MALSRRPEEIFGDLTPEGVELLRDDLDQLGYSRAVVDGCVGWVQRRQRGQRAVTSTRILADYRAMLWAVLAWRGHQVPRRVRLTAPGLWAAVA